MPQWFVDPVGEKILINRDMWDDASLFINGKTGIFSSILDYEDGTRTSLGNNFLGLDGNLPFLTEVQAGGDGNIYSFYEPTRIYELEPVYSINDSSNVSILRLVGTLTDNIYIFINIIPNKGIGLFSNEKETINKGEAFAKAGGATIGIIVLNSAFTFLDPLSMEGVDKSIFSHVNQTKINPNRPNSDNFSQIILSKDENGIVNDITLPYLNPKEYSNSAYIQKTSSLAIDPLGNIPLSVVKSIRRPTTSELSSEVVKENVEDERVKISPKTKTTNQQTVSSSRETPKERIQKRKDASKS